MNCHQQRTPSNELECACGSHKSQWTPCSRPLCSWRLLDQIERLQAALALLPSPGTEREFAWVIEKGAEPKYYAPTEPGEWTKDHLKACRFARKEDAEAVQFRHVTHGHLPEYNTRVCEHGWIDQASPGTERSKALEEAAKIIENNIERCDDLLFDFGQQPFDKSNGAVLGVIAVTKQMRDSLDGLVVRLAALASNPGEAGKIESVTLS